MTLAVRTLKNISQRYANTMGKEHIIETFAPKIRGTNPTLRYLHGNQDFYLDRFCSQEMQQARNLNKIAINQARNSVETQFCKATKGDLKRLTSESIEDSYSRVTWTNPKDGQIYNILKQGETADGNISIKILDKDGDFVKNAVVQPKIVTIIDVFQDNSILHLSHGVVVESIAKRYNPLAKYRKINVSSENWNDINNKLAMNLKNKDIGDYISMSLGAEVCVENASKVSFSMIKEALFNAKNDGISELAKVFEQYINQNCRVLVSSGNDGKFSFNQFLVKIKGSEGVGSLVPKTGKISDFSASRNSFYTQHYEVGEIPVKKVYKNGNLYGLSFTGQGGCDILVSKFKELVEKPWYLNQRLLKNKEKQMVDIENKIKYFKSKENVLLKYLGTEKTIKPFGCFTKVSDSSQKYQDILFEVQKQIFKLKCKANKLDLDIKSLNNIEREDAMDILSNFNGGMLRGTSFSTPIRVAKLSLNEMMKGIL